MLFFTGIICLEEVNGSEVISKPDQHRNSTSATDSDEEQLFTASKEVELSLKTTENYKYNSISSDCEINVIQPYMNIKGCNSFNQLPVPIFSSLFSNCTFKYPINIVYKH